MKRLLAVLLLVAAPAHAEVPPEGWTKCVIGVLHTSGDTLTGSVTTRAVSAAVQCRPLYRGEPGHDVDMAVRIVEVMRNQASVSKPVPLPPADRRF